MDQNRLFIPLLQDLVYETPSAQVLSLETEERILETSNTETITDGGQFGWN